MYTYHDSDTQKGRLKRGIDRCPSSGASYDLEALVKKGVISDPRTGKCMTTSPISVTSEGTTDAKDAFIFAVNGQHEIRIAPDGNRHNGDLDEVKHETLFHNDDVMAAGEIQITDGSVHRINDHSGSYRTWGMMELEPGFAKAVLKALREKRDIPCKPRLVAFLHRLAASLQ